MCADLDPAAAAETAAVIRDKGGDATDIAVDVASLSSVEAMAAVTEQLYGPRVAAVVNAAGVSEYGRAGDLEPQLWQRVIDVNLTGTWHVIRAFLPSLVRAGSSSIVNVSSVAGLRGVPMSAAYAASKAGVIGLTRQVAVDYGNQGVRCNAVCPGTIDTPMVRRGYRIKGQGDDAVAVGLERARRRFALGRVGTADDAASLIAFLVGNQSTWITGAVVPLDGGFTATGWLPQG